jgi:NADPH-dependent glutamate synthase beta subunit-like oxidoreductase
VETSARALVFPIFKDKKSDWVGMALREQTTSGNTRVAIIGGGIAGLSAAYDLARQGGYALTVYEGNPFLGGLAAGFILSPPLHQ